MLLTLQFACCLMALLLSAGLAHADTVETHFLGADPKCVQVGRPVLLVLDLTLKGEIDDSITAHITRQTERLGCVRVIAAVSIFGNGESTTAEVHRNMESRLPKLGCGDWLLLRGPDESFTRVRTLRREIEPDRRRLQRIAEVIAAEREPVTILEAGPMTVTARLLNGGYLKPDRIAAIYGVGGRMRGEVFQTGRNLGRMFSFSDFNMRKDILAVDHIVRHQGRKLTMVTYQTGIGTRTVPAEIVARDIPAIAEHAFARKKTARRLGFWQSQIPSWDTWPLRLQLVGGAAELKCQHRRVLVSTEALGGDVWSRARLVIDPPGGRGHRVRVCHK